jgi:hypothetical protein|tara:strand:- start:938 stop:1315 length:378 start_codon:yes stop_codon:yes gene_type:complete
VKKIKGITKYKPTSIVKNGVRYIVDEDADMRALRNALKRRDDLLKNEQENDKIMAFVERVLCLDLGYDDNVEDNYIDAQSVARLMKDDGVTVAAVRRAMASPEGLLRFRRTLTDTGRVAWALPTA